MRSKKMAVRYGLLTVLLVSLSLTSTSNAWTIYRPNKAATPELSRWELDWRGGIKLFLHCDTPGATIRYTWAPGRWATAPIPTSASHLYWIPLRATCVGQLKARAFKSGYDSSGVLTVNVR
ncbi:chitobiase/beta-hexosaminidase C-terminal domain-containing protein [Planctomycetota bacterium]